MVRGIRQVLDRWVPRPRTNERDLTADPDWWRGFGLLHRYGLSFDLQVRPDQHEPVADRLADCPETMVVLNHIGAFSERSYPNWRLWRRGLRKLADRPNTWIKISGPGMYDDAPTVESVRPYVFEALETFGWERAMFASNFPVDKRSIDYPALWAIFARSVASLPDTQQSALLRDNASRFYRL
jgi:predicted TIM-barrel fold metal-dependent hydrolase